MNLFSYYLQNINTFFNHISIGLSSKLKIISESTPFFSLAKILGGNSINSKLIDGDYNGL